MHKRLDKRLIESCKEAISDVESKKNPDFLSSFSQRHEKARESGDKELEGVMKLLWGAFSMYFQFTTGEPFGPLGNSTQGRTMIPKDLTEENLCNLEEILQISDNPEVVARISDLLWLRRTNHLFAEKAIQSYLKSVDEDIANEQWVPKSKWLKRATQITMELGKRAEEREVVKKKLLYLFEISRKNCFNPQQDYWPASILNLIIENKFADNWEELGDKSVEIAKGFHVSPGCDTPCEYYKLAAKCYTYAIKPQKVEDVKLAVAKHWEDEARCFNTPQGCFHLAHFLKKAIHAYREIEMKEKAEELIHEYKEANKVAVSQMKCIKRKIDVTQLIKTADDSLQGKNGLAAITAFISLYNPCSYDKQKISAENSLKQYPVQAILTKSIITPEGNVSENIAGMLKNNEERIQSEIINQYNLSQNFVASTILKQGISIILKSDGTWKKAIKELVNKSKFVPKDRADVYERSIIAGFEEDFLISTHLIIPQLENSIRVIFALNKFKTTSVLPLNVQKEKNLNELLIDVNAEKIFGKDLLWEMRSLLIEQSGPNLRNRLCHGLMDSNSVNSPMSIFLLWLTLYLIIDFESK
ncbi:MAG: DUF4209 domain-containing protein [Nanoarchaeota archaeon]